MRISEAFFYLALIAFNISCGNQVETKAVPKDTGNYVKISSFEWNQYSTRNYLPPYNSQIFSFGGSNIVSLANILGGQQNFIQFTMYFQYNNLPIDNVKNEGGGGHPNIFGSCASGTRYYPTPIARVRLFKDGINTRSYDDCTRPSYPATGGYVLVYEDCIYAIHPGSTLLSSSFSVASDIVTGNYTLRFYDGNDNEFYSVVMVVAP